MAGLGVSLGDGVDDGRSVEVGSKGLVPVTTTVTRSKILWLVSAICGAGDAEPEVMKSRIASTRQPTPRLHSVLHLLVATKRTMLVAWRSRRSSWAGCRPAEGLSRSSIPY